MDRTHTGHEDDSQGAAGQGMQHEREHEHGAPSGWAPGGHSEHDRHEGHSVAMFRDKFWLSLALTIPVLIWSPDIQAWFGYTAPVFPGSEYLPAVLGTVIFFYGGGVFLHYFRTAYEAA